MKYLEGSIDFSKTYLIKEGRLAIKSEERDKLNEKVVDLVNNKIEEITSIKKLDKQAAIDNKFVKIKVSGIGTYKF